MELRPESLRYILGLKLRLHRIKKGWGLKEMARATGLSVSYLSEIEKGRKYPKPDKMIDLARGLGLTYEELVSPKVQRDLDPVLEFFASPLLQEFPFHLFGMEPEQLVALVSEVPSKAGALLRTFLEIGRAYDFRVEHFLFSALRSYQRLEGNFFPQIEAAAQGFLEEYGWQGQRTLEEAALRKLLEEEHGYRVDLTTLAEHPDLSDLRSVFVDDDPPRLLLNGGLSPSQRAFALGRELGYRRLGYGPSQRSPTSGYLRVGSFEEVIHDFEAAYFSGAILLQRQLLVPDLEAFFARERWSGDAFTAFLERYATTPETFFYRLTQLLPRDFGFETLFFLRFHDQPVELTKILNMTALPIPLGAEPGEHYCRRWPGLRRLRQLARGQDGEGIHGAAERSHFVTEGEAEEYLVLTLARPLSLTAGRNTSVSVGFRLDEKVRNQVRFWDDPAIPRPEVHFTCERCPLRDCRERAAPASILESEEGRARRQRALEELLERMRAGD
jgi:transcriptional regulator with XRE-family HTH domain